MTNRSRIIYGIALGLAAIIIAMGFFVTRQTNREIDEKFQQYKAHLKAEKAAGRLQPGMAKVDIDSLSFENVGMPVSDSLMFRFDLTRWVEDYWYVLVPVVVAHCLGLAFLVNLVAKAISKGRT